MTAGYAPQEGDGFQSANKKKQGRILQLTQAQALSGLYGIRDVLLPLPGSGVTLPSNDMAQVYEDLLAKDGLTMEDYGTGNLTYRMSGAYRRLLQVPQFHTEHWGLRPNLSDNWLIW